MSDASRATQDREAKPTHVITAELHGRWWAVWIADILGVQAVPVKKELGIRGIPSTWGGHE